MENKNDKIKRAIISLTDKEGIENFAKELSSLGIEILSTGGTAKKLRDSGIEVIDVAEYTGFPEMLDGRVKTLHPKVHGGILNKRDNSEHQRQCREYGIKNIDMVIVNLYAFEKTVADKKCTLEDAIENIDIGGPSMLRAAAKNYRDITVIVDPSDYPLILDEIKEYGNTTLRTRFYLMRKVYALTAAYDKAISEWLEKIDSNNDIFNE